MLGEELLAIIENPADCVPALFELAMKFGGDRILESLTTLAVDGVTKLLEVSANSRGSYVAQLFTRCRTATQYQFWLILW